MTKAIRRQKTTEELQRQCDEWNAANPVGTAVHYHPVIDERNFRHYRTAGPASVMGGHTPVVKLEGMAGVVAIEACEPVACEDCARPITTRKQGRPIFSVHVAGPVQNGDHQECIRCGSTLIDYRGMTVVFAEGAAPHFWANGASIISHAGFSADIGDRALEPDEMPCTTVGVGRVQ